MSDETKIIQKAALGSDTTQIGEQNNYYGMTAEEASNLAIKLFMDNFPRLQEEAKKIAKERAEELCEDIVDKLEKQGKTNFSEFSDPDIQYILNKSHQEYARFGTQTLRDLLSNLIVNRINYDNDHYMKILLDEAVEIVKSLSEVHLNLHLMLEYTPRALVFSDGQLIADRRASEVLCDPELIERAALKETSLFTLANHCAITPPEAFVERFIGEDREVRSHGC